MEYQIKLMEENQLKETIDVCVNCFGKDWRKIAEADFPECVGTYPYKPTALVALDDSKVIGMSVVTPVFFAQNSYSIAWLCVEEEYRSQGLGTTLVQKSEEYILERVSPSNNAMVMLASGIDSKYYESLGYSKKCTTPDDDPLMVKHLKPLNNPIGIV